MMQSSPSSYSSQSRASPVSQENYYAHHPAQAATYALQTHSPIEQQPVIYQQQPIQQHMQHHSQPTPISQAHHVQESYPTPTEQHGQWYDHSAYQPPVEVINHLPSYGQSNVFHDPWDGPKIETFDDPSLQMPSARIESL